MNKETLRLDAFLRHLNSGEPVRIGSEIYDYMCILSSEAQRLTHKINSQLKSPEEIVLLMSEFVIGFHLNYR